MKLYKYAYASGLKNILSPELREYRDYDAERQKVEEEEERERRGRGEGEEKKKERGKKERILYK